MRTSRIDADLRKHLVEVVLRARPGSVIDLPVPEHDGLDADVASLEQRQRFHEAPETAKGIGAACDIGDDPITAADLASIGQSECCGWIGLEKTADGVRLVQVSRARSNAGGAETVLTAPVTVDGPVWVRARFEPVSVADPVPGFADYLPSMLRSTHARVSFSYSVDGTTFTAIGPGMTTQPGRWVGTQIGVFAQAASGTPSFVATRVGYAEFEHFTVSE